MAAVDIVEGFSLDFGVAIQFKNGTAITLAHDGVRAIGNAALHRFSTDGFSAETQISPVSGGVRIDSRIDCGKRIGDVDQLVLFDSDVSQFGFERIFSNRREIWLHTGLRDIDGEPLEDFILDKPYDADNMAALYTPGKGTLLAGILMPGRWGLVFAVENQRLQVRLELESGLPADGRIFADSFVLLHDPSLLDALLRYGSMNRIARSGTAHIPRRVIWNTWDYFGRQIDQRGVVEMAKLIAGHPVPAGKVNVICLDDGWATYGDQSTPNESFSDLAGMARGLAEAGFIPGIWYAPFLSALDSNWTREHPDTLLRGESRFGDKPPAEVDPRQVLDPTHPEVLDKIHREMSWLREIGFRYYKTDFLQRVNTQFRNATFHDRNVTPVEAMRGCMEVIRAAIGQDSYWLACGTEILPCAGLADASRTGDDITLYFPTIQVAMRDAMMHMWMNGNLFLNDPDFLVVRCPDTHEGWLHEKSKVAGEEQIREKQPYQRAKLSSGPVWKKEEARCWANFHIVYGGVLSLGDHPAMLNADGLAMLDKVLEYHSPGAAGMPLDIEENNLPTRWLRPHPEGWLLGLFNLYDDNRTITISEADAGRIGPVATAIDIWSGEELPWSTGFGVELAPHASRVFRLAGLKTLP